jgi:D-alanyl-D-alanine carboxypeptidase/D-alanyl-D-alanine-endopeptidase (penicillin-binding protein 4)
MHGVMLRRRSIRQDDRLTILVMTGNDTAGGGLCHSNLLTESAAILPYDETMRVVVFWILGLLGFASAAGAEPVELDATARAILGADQGVYVETADGTVLLAQAADRPVHPASVSKVPTTLALLRKLGPEHRFVTTFYGSGRILDGALYGDLSVESEGDPSLVDESALLVAERLKQAGIQRVAGNLLTNGTLIFDWRSDPDGASLRRALSGLTPRAASAAVLSLGNSPLTGIHPLGIQFVAPAQGHGVELQQKQALVIYRSQPLLPLVKSLNDYSNNIIKPFADAAGGATEVEALARSVVPPEMRSEITLGDGAGTDPSNRLSPRVTVKLLRALEKELALSGHALYDILPVSGVDNGTLHDRLNGAQEGGRVVGKTGTFGDYGASALAGAIQTTDRGTVYFAILNHNVPVPQARQRQDRFVRVLLAHLHTVPWKYVRDDRPAIERAEASIAPR